MIDVSTTMDRIEQRIAAANLTRAGYLATARISPSTWWRWRQGMSPKLSTWHRALLAADLLE